MWQNDVEYGGTGCHPHGPSAGLGIRVVQGSRPLPNFLTTSHPQKWHRKGIGLSSSYPARVRLTFPQVPHFPDQNGYQDLIFKP